MEAKGTILLVDDEPHILELLKYNIAAAGYQVYTADNGEDAVVEAVKTVPDLILLDRMLPGKDGIQTLKEMRRRPELDETIVIFLTALGDEKSEIEGLENGADDYISKPIKPDLLLTRVQTALRRKNRSQSSDGQIMNFGNLEINKENFTVHHNGKEITLAKKEFELLVLLASKPSRVFLRAEILQKVWGTDVIVGDRTIDVHIRKIRQKLDADFIVTVKGVGYKFQAEE